MHTKLLEKASPEQLKSFLFEQFGELKKNRPDLYAQMECDLYEHLYGNHFCDWKYEEAVKELKNEDGRIGAHWSMEETMAVSKSKGVRFDGFNEYDFAYVMNMVYSDFYGAVPDTIDSYYKLAKAFLEDKDAPEGKAYRYYKAMRKEG